MPNIIKHDKKIELRSEEVQEILSNPPIWIVRWGITLIFMFVCIIISLAFMIKYPDFVKAKILVSTKTPTEKIISRQSGQLEEIFIKNRDTVSINQKLAIIKNTANYQHILRLKYIIDTHPFTFQDFNFPFHKTSNLFLGEVGIAYINFEKSYTEYSLLKKLSPYSNRMNGNKTSLKEIKSRLKNQILQKKILDQEFVLKQRELDRYQRLFEKEIISKQNYEEKQLDFLQIQKTINTMAISISQMTEALSDANQNLESTRINEQEDKTRFLNNLMQSYELLKESIREWEYNYLLTSSIKGVISFQDYWGVQQFVNTGDVVFSILPTQTSVLVGKLLLPAQNAGKVTVGQKVFIKLDNYPYQQYGMLIGNVTNFSISPDKEGNYTVYISLPNGTKTSYNKTFKFRQELLGNAEIITENLSVAERIFYKFKDLFKYQ